MMTFVEKRSGNNGLQYGELMVITGDSVGVITSDRYENERLGS